MKIETITVTERKNKGNYEHIEISASAKVEEGENEMTAMLTLKTYVQTALMENTIIKKQEEIEKNISVFSEPKVVLPVEEVAVEEKPKKEKKVKKDKIVAQPTISEVESAPEETPEESAKKTPPKSNNILYSSEIKEHKSIFGGYLAKKYNDAWKTAKPAEEIKAFTATLNGKHFLDNDGKIVDSFLDLVHGFFGA